MAECRITIDSNGDISRVAGDTDVVVGWTWDELVGMPVRHLIPDRYRADHTTAHDRFRATGEKRAMGSWLDVEALHRDGREIPITMVLTERDGVVTAILKLRA